MIVKIAYFYSVLRGEKSTIIYWFTSTLKLSALIARFMLVKQ